MTAIEIERLAELRKLVRRTGAEEAEWEKLEALEKKDYISPPRDFRQPEVKEVKSAK